MFCVHKHQNQDSINPLDLSQWEFYLLPTKILDEKISKQKKLHCQVWKKLVYNYVDMKIFIQKLLN